MLPNSFLALRIALAQGIQMDVQCKKLVEDLEAYPEEGVRLTIKSVSSGDVNDVVKCEVTYEKFDDINRPYESSNYFDKSGNAKLTARESGNYTINETLYFMTDSDPNDYFVELNVGPLFKAYNANRKDSSETYVQYLERLVTTNNLV
jgi:hypothetical protein